MPAHTAPPSSSGVQGVNIRPTEATNAKPTSAAGNTKPGISKAPAPLVDRSKIVPLPGAAEMAARNKPEPPSDPLDEPLKAETMSSAPAEKQESINAAKEIIKDHPALDHLSAPASAIQSGTATPQPEPEVAPSEGVGTGRSSMERRHRGSEVFEAPLDEIRKIESENALKEEDEDEDENASKVVDSSTAAEGEKTQEQDAKEAGDASKSVGD